jgi:hypothetical protein
VSAIAIPNRWREEAVLSDGGTAISNRGLQACPKSVRRRAVATQILPVTAPARAAITGVRPAASGASTLHLASVDVMGGVMISTSKGHHHPPDLWSPEDNDLLAEEAASDEIRRRFEWDPLRDVSAAFEDWPVTSFRSRPAPLGWFRPSRKPAPRATLRRHGGRSHAR